YQNPHGTTRGRSAQSHRREPADGRSRGSLREERMQAEVVFPELAAVVAGRDLDDTGTTGGIDADAQGVLDRGTVQAVHHDLQDGVHTLRQFARHAGASAKG